MCLTVTMAARHDTVLFFLRLTRRAAAGRPVLGGSAGARVRRRRLAPAPAFEGFAESEDFGEDTELRSWPTLSTLPESIVNQIIANRNRVPSRAGEIRLAPNGYYALGKNFPPSVLVSPQEEQNPRVKEIITRLSVEVGGEGRTASVMTGDAASFTWGVGLAHGGSARSLGE